MPSTFLSQVVTLGCFGVVANCIKFEILASLGPEEEQPPSGWRFAQLEVAAALIDHFNDGGFYDDDDDGENFLKILMILMILIILIILMILMTRVQPLTWVTISQGFPT